MNSPENSSPESSGHSSPEQSSYCKHITKLTLELQKMADQTNAQHKAENTPTQTERLHVFDGVTKPESRRYEPSEKNYRTAEDGYSAESSPQSSDSDKLITTLRQAGIDLKDESKIKQILDSEEMIRDGRVELAKLLEAERITPEQLQRIESLGVSDLLKDIITQRFKEALGGIDLEQRIRPEYVEPIDELTNNPQIDAYVQIMSIITDNEMKLDQGRVSNVVLSDRSPYVLKIVKPTANWGADSLRDFTPVRDSLGDEFLLSQAVVTLKNPNDAKGKDYIVSSKIKST